MPKDHYLHPLEEDELELGITLPWTVYTAAGQLLMREGSVVDNQRKLDNLLSNGHREKLGKPSSGEEEEEEGPPPGEPQPVAFARNTNPFSELDEIGYDLKSLFERIEFKSVKPGEVERKIYEMAAQIQGLAAFNKIGRASCRERV